MGLLAGLPAEQRTVPNRRRRRHRSCSSAIVVTEAACAEAVAVAVADPRHQSDRKTRKKGSEGDEDPNFAKLRRKIERGRSRRDRCESLSKRAAIAKSVAELEYKLAQLQQAGSARSSSRHSRELSKCSAPSDGVTSALPTSRRGRPPVVCVSPRAGSSIMGVTESKETQQARAARFESSPTKAAQWLWHDSASGSPRGQGGAQLCSPTSVVGTCATLEKEYARVPAGMVPDPATIRPANVLRSALKMVLRRWAERPADERTVQAPEGMAADSNNLGETYTWVTSQLRSIRQDLTVQNLRGKVARRCYSAAVRCALDASDWAEFSPSLSRLFELYNEEGDSPPAEFHAYRMLKLISEALRCRASSSTALVEQLRGLVLPSATFVAKRPSGSRLGKRTTRSSSLLAAPEVAHAHALLGAIAGGQLHRALSLAQTGCVEQHGHAAGLVTQQIATSLRAMLDAATAKAVRSVQSPTRPIATGTVKRKQQSETCADTTGKAAEPARKRKKAAKKSKKSSK